MVHSVKEPSSRATGAAPLAVQPAASDAADAWTRTIWGFLAHARTTPDDLAQTLERAPDFAAGWAARGLMLMLLGRSELHAEAARSLARAREIMAAGGATKAERALAAALAAWLSGRMRRAAAILETALRAHPEDALLMKLVHAVRFMLGDPRGMLRAMSDVIDAYDAGHPFRGYALGCFAFALEENGLYREAEAQGRAGLEIAADDAWGLHAVAHVHDMTGRAEEGIRLLESATQRWAHCNNFGYHVWWHLALFHLDRGEHDRVLALYDEKIRAEHTDDYRDIANGASMLLRLELEGVDVGERWEELAALAAGRVEDGAVVFADLHYLMALEQAGREAQARALIDRLARDAARADHDMHEVAAIAGLPTARGLAAFRAGNYALAWEALSGVLPVLVKIGGSHAQRDVFERLAIEAAIRAGRWREAEAALLARARRRGGEDGYTARRRAELALRRASSPVG